MPCRDCGSIQTERYQKQPMWSGARDYAYRCGACGCHWVPADPCPNCGSLRTEDPENDNTPFPESYRCFACGHTW